MNKKIWLIGAGLMANDYIKVLKTLNKDFIVIGRDSVKVEKLKSETGVNAIAGGLDNYLKTKPTPPDYVINATGIDMLAETTTALLDYGVKKILVEKPGIAYPIELKKLVSKTKELNAEVFIAYNRRFYASVLKAENIILEDGGITSFHFEFTEWSHVIRTLQKTNAEWHNWFLGNSTHLIDLAFYLGGSPVKISTFTKGSLDWHPAAAIYAGAGETDRGALFSYMANWDAPGRWGLEILTHKHRLIFKPVETLQIQKLGSVAVGLVEIDDTLDKDFKPGLYRQTEHFLNNRTAVFCDVFEQEQKWKNVYKKMSNYNDEIS